jgi:hypothetical protein
MMDMHEQLGFEKTENIYTNEDMQEHHDLMHSGGRKSYTTHMSRDLYGQNIHQGVWHHFFMVITLVLLMSFLLTGTMFFIKQLKVDKNK